MSPPACPAAGCSLTAALPTDEGSQQRNTDTQDVLITVLYCALYCTVYTVQCILQYVTVLYCTLYTTVHFTVMYCTLYSTVHFTALYIVLNCVL